MDLNLIRNVILHDPVLSGLSRLARERGVPLFLVGGYIRDLLLGLRRRDYDLAMPGEASFFISVIEEAFGFHFFRTGKEEAETTYRILKNDLSMDLSFFQGTTIEEDLKRRDFTINAIAFSLHDERFHWVEGALEDMEKRIIRSVSDRSIDRDPLRMLRAVRYFSSLDGFELDRGLLEEISLKKTEIKKIPGERIKMEMDKILLSVHRTPGMKVLRETSLLLTLLPELTGLKDLEQGPYHHLDALSHTLLALEKISWAVERPASKKQVPPLSEEDRLAVEYAALFHDMGKEKTYSMGENGRIHFYGHEAHSCLAAGEAMERLRFPNSLKEKVLPLIEHHMRILNLPRQTKDPVLKRLVNRMGDLTPLLVILALADKEASRGAASISRDEVVERHCLRLLELVKQEEIVRPPPLITGRDVIALGYRPGPRVGRILKIIQQRQVGGEIKTREEALRVLREKYGRD